MTYSYFDTKWHAQLGTFLVGLLLLQVGLAAFRPERGDKTSLPTRKRRYWVISHKILGLLLPILGSITMYGGLVEASTSPFWTYLPLFWLVVLIIIASGFEWRKWQEEKALEEKKASDDSSLDVSLDEESDRSFLSSSQ